MADGNQKVADVDMMTLMSELRRQNEEMLNKHKEELEKQFRAQMDDALTRIKGQSDTRGLVGRRRINPSNLDDLTAQFHRSAQALDTAPKYKVNDGKVTLRASVEGREISEPLAVSTGAKSSGKSVSSSSSRRRKKAAPMDPRFAKYAEPVWDVGKSGKHKNARSSNSTEATAEEIEGLDTAIVDYYGEPLDAKKLPATGKPKTEARAKKAYSELGDVTGYLLRKSEWMVQDADKSTGRKKKQKKAAKKRAEIQRIQQIQQQQQQQQGMSLPPITTPRTSGSDGDQYSAFYSEGDEGAEAGDSYAYDQDFEAGGEFAAGEDDGSGFGNDTQSLVPRSWAGDGGGIGSGVSLPPLATDESSINQRPGTSGARAGARPGGSYRGGGPSSMSMSESLASDVGHVNYPVSPAPAPAPHSPEKQMHYDVVDLPQAQHAPTRPDPRVHPDLEGKCVVTTKRPAKQESPAMSKVAASTGDTKTEGSDAYGEDSFEDASAQSTSPLPPPLRSGRAKNAETLGGERRGSGELAENDNAYDPIGWENQIARHILSMYASTKYAEDEYNSKVILDYADQGKVDSIDDLKKELAEDPLAGTYESRVKAWNDDEKANNAEEEDGEDAEDGASGADLSMAMSEQDGPIINAARGVDTRIGTLKQPPSPDRMKESGLPIYADAAPPPVKTSFGRSHYADELREEQRLRAETGKRKKKYSIYDKEGTENRFRTQTKVLTKDFREVVIRGLPKAACIWFSSTSDVYSDWTLLPGGEKLQNQLATMLERKRYYE